MRALAEELRRAGATQVSTVHDSGKRRLVSEVRDATGMRVALGRDAEDDFEGVVDAVRRADGRDGFDVSTRARSPTDAGVPSRSGQALARDETRSSIATPSSRSVERLERQAARVGPVRCGRDYGGGPCQ